MSGVLGIIAEYNPFHQGHFYHLMESKKQSGCNYAIAVMSGNFMQRGEPAIVDKWSRAEMAVRSGVDLVIELPTVYSISSAENFAEGAIKVLDSLSIVDTFSFGSEVASLDVLNEFAEILYREPAEYISILNHELSKGISYPKARENALLMYLNDIRRYANVLSSPNNILGIEYLKAIKKLRSSMVPFTIERLGPKHDELKIANNIASASYIRKILSRNKLQDTASLLPKPSFAILEDCSRKGNMVFSLSTFEKEILYCLRKMSLEEIAALPDVSEGLEHLIKESANSCNSVTELIAKIKTKRYTETRIRRILLYTLLGITKKEMLASRKITPYIRVLALNGNGKKLLSDIAISNPKLPIITSVKRFMDTNSNKTLHSMLQKDIFATNVYTLGYEYDSVANLDYTHKLVTMQEE